MFVDNIYSIYISIETKEVARIGYNGFLFPDSYSCGKNKPVISNTDRFFPPSIPLYLKHIDVSKLPQRQMYTARRVIKNYNVL